MQVVVPGQVFVMHGPTRWFLGNSFDPLDTNVPKIEGRGEQHYETKKKIEEVDRFSSQCNTYENLFPVLSVAGLDVQQRYSDLFWSAGLSFILTSVLWYFFYHTSRTNNAKRKSIGSQIISKKNK